MKIKYVECDQFAGVYDKRLEFDKGLNIVVGDNECGKSTMIDLIFYLLFKNVKLDKRSDSEFMDKYFPKSIGKVQGDVIDGALVFETEKGAYKIKKEWEKGEGSCKLTLPDRTTIKNMDSIENVLNEELGFRAGVFSEIVFASQKRNQMAVESILKTLGKKADAFSETREDLTSTLRKAALETGGVSLEKIEKNIKNNMDTLSGRWDFKADAPEGGPKRASYENAWANGIGLIAKAYYEADEVRRRQTEAENAERTVENEKNEIKELKLRKKEIESKKEEFQKYKSTLDQIALLNKSVEELDNRIKEQENVLKIWPDYTKNLSLARQLQEKENQARVRDLYLKIENAYNALSKEKEKLDSLKLVDPKDLKELRNLLALKQKEEGRLAGMNLVAKISSLGSEKISITALSSGKEISLEDGLVSINEAVDINVPGVLSMQLMPKGVDIEAVKDKLVTYDNLIEDIYKKYDETDIEKLQEMSDIYTNTKHQVEKLQLEFEAALGTEDWEKIKKDNQLLPEKMESLKEIKSQLTDLCGAKSLDAYIGGLETKLSDYENKYISLENLQSILSAAESEIQKNQKKIDSFGDIPEEYKNINNFDEYDEKMQNKLDDIDALEKVHTEKMNDAYRLLGDKSSEEYYEELQIKEAELENRKNEYAHWSNIYNVFSNLKGENSENSVDDIEEKFNEYLEVITDGKLKVEAMDEKMSTSLSSGRNALTYYTLSEGTKDTVSLAFRLAMLEHIYPQGDGIAVFDDPFTDMDEKRTMQACKLLQKYADDGNQVIFVTCDTRYKDLLNGNIIEI